MKLSDAAKYLPFVQAAAEGKIIQYKSKVNGSWTDCSDCYDWFIRDEIEFRDFRIKPTPTFRPWTPKEVPVGALIRYVSWYKEVKAMILSCNNEGITCLDCSGDGIRVNYSELRLLYVHSLDHGKTWLPCGVEE